MISKSGTLVIIGLLSLCVFCLFIQNVKRTENYELTKEYIKLDVENDILTFKNMLNRNNEKVNQKNVLTNFLSKLKQNNEKDNFYFVLDMNGNFLINGNEDMEKNLENFFNENKIDKDFSAFDNLDNRSMQPMYDFIQTAKKMGGFVDFNWTNDKPMIAYVKFLSNTPLIIGKAIKNY